MDQVAHTDELDFLIIRAQEGDLDAFGTIVLRFQDNDSQRNLLLKTPSPPIRFKLIFFFWCKCISL